MSSYTLTQREYSTLKGRLTRVIRAGDPQKIIDEVDRAERIFDEKGWPDAWSRWTCARDDARLQLRLKRPGLFG